MGLEEFIETPQTYSKKFLPKSKPQNLTVEGIKTPFFEESIPITPPVNLTPKKTVLDPLKLIVDDF
jgi:hypothetical protein